MSVLAASELVTENGLQFDRMQPHDLDEVVQVETAVFPSYGHWTRQSFESAIKAGYDCWLVRDRSGKLIGYFVIKKVVDEAHLLTIAVHENWQGKGIGRLLLGKVLDMAVAMKIESLLLEVRLSNVRAIELYQNYGFVQIGRRKNYYAGADQSREDALVMRLAL